MTISFKTGAWTSRTTTGIDVISGVGFTPKIIIFFSSADFNTDDTFGADYNFRFGVATDTTAANQGGMACYSQDGASVTNTDRVWNSTGPLVREVGHSPTIVGAVSAIGSDGFTVNWTTVDGSAHRIHYICIGGTDITNVKSGILTSPAATGNVAYTGPGFKPDFLMLWGNQTTTAGATGSTFGLGFATSSTNQVVLSAASQNNLAPSGTRRYQRSDNVLCLVELDGSDAGSPNNTALGGSLVTMDTNGFTINWSVAITAGQSKNFGYLAVKGGNWKVGSSTSKTSTGTQAVTGVGFQPNGLILASICQISSTGVGTGNRISFGGGSSSSDNRCVFSGDTTALSTTVSASIQKAAKCISAITEAATHTSSTVNAEAAISTLDSNGFTLNWSTASATAYEFLYVAVGGGAAPQNITSTVPTETNTISAGTAARTVTHAGNNITKAVPAQTITISEPSFTRNTTKTRSPVTQISSIADSISTSVLTSTGIRRVSRVPPIETTIITGGTVATTLGHVGVRNITRVVPVQTVNISDSVTRLGPTRFTGDYGYWQPLKPLIKIYAFTDSTYSSPLYTYNSFTDTGTIDKPLSLEFGSETTTAGTFSLEIDDSGDTLDPDVFLRGNRITIDCSKDGVHFQPAFRGLVRSAKQKVYGPGNRTLFIDGYSYLVRLNERLLSTQKQAAILGTDYDRADSTMYTGNLLNTLLTVDSNYIYTLDDTQLYSVYKTNNLTASPITDWIPRLDADLVSVNDAINSILEYSQSLVNVDFSNDQLVLFNPERVPSGGATAFLLTDDVKLQSDSDEYTMYPTAEYTYEISYDSPDSANRLMSSIGSAQCPEQTIPGRTTAGAVGASVYSNVVTQGGVLGSAIYNNWTVDNFIGLGTGLTTPVQRLGIYVADVDLIGKIIGRIAFAVRKGAGTGSIRFGIRKASGDVLIDFGTLDVTTIPGDGLFHGYQMDNLNQLYTLVSGDHITVENINLSSSISVGLMAGSNTDPPHRFDGSSWIADISGYMLTAQVYQSTADTSNYGTVSLNGSTVQRVAILVAAGSGLIGTPIGRISLSLRTGGTSPNGTYQVGIRRGSDDFFIDFGGGPFNTSTFTPKDNTFRDYFFDALSNQYVIVAGDRISIEVSGMTTGHIDLQASKDGGSPNTVQIWNGTAWSTTGVTSFRLGAEVFLTTATSTPGTTIDPCGGLPETADADPIFYVANDRNMAKRIGVIEQVISGIPPSIKKLQTMTEYFFNKIYVAAKPRFTFDYPSVTLPNIMPKAGDIVSHVSKKAKVGLKQTPIQTGIISSITYSFDQGSDSVLGLRNISLTTTGVIRGSY